MRFDPGRGALLAIVPPQVGTEPVKVCYEDRGKGSMPVKTFHRDELHHRFYFIVTSASVERNNIKCIAIDKNSFRKEIIKKQGWKKLDYLKEKLLVRKEIPSEQPTEE